MPNSAAAQIEQIHSMLERGQRSVRLERHTLILWGLIASSLIIFIDLLITPERMPILWHRIVLSNSIIAIVVFVAAIWDFRHTRQAREQRDESVSYIQFQLTKVWWFILTLIVLINLGVNVFGGGYLFYPILIALTGLGFFIHGLFSQQLLVWNGILIVLAGLTAITLRIPFQTMEWFTVFLFGLGLPTMAWLIDLPVVKNNLKQRILISLGWLSMITVPTWFIHYQTNKVVIPDWPVISLQEYQQKTDTGLTDYAVKIPAGTTIPLNVKISSDTLSNSGMTTIPLTLSKAVTVAMNKGKADGRYRIDEGEWLNPRRQFFTRKTRLDATITVQDGVQIDIDFILKVFQ
ncbi:MAG: hypothetical protein OEY52_01050 [Gammaproteobacteria bacterium]|nr:hypothetical protein [Gammaproteobacteria bacterium]